jgi:hypothetical protein
MRLEMRLSLSHNICVLSTVELMGESNQSPITGSIFAALTYFLLNFLSILPSQVAAYSANL